MRISPLVSWGAVLLAAAGTAHALDASSGSTVTELFRAADVVSGLQYPAGFDGVRWDDSSITRFELGSAVNGPSTFLAHDNVGTVYAVVHGQTGTGLPRYKGLVSWDGSTFRHLAQDTLDPDPSTGLTQGRRLFSVAVAPVTVGALTAGHPVVLRDVYPEAGGTASERWTEIWSIAPASGAQTFVHRLSTGLGASVTIDVDGNLFVNDMGTIRKVAPTPSGYVETVLVSGLYADGVVLGTDGALYALSGSTTWGQRRGSNEVLRIDTDTGQATVHGQVSRQFGGLRAATVDDAGTLWLALLDTRAEVVVPLAAGVTLSPRDAPSAAETGLSLLRSVAPAPGGGLLVAEWSSVLATAETVVLRLEPAAGGGEGGGGKGKKR